MRISAEAPHKLSDIQTSILDNRAGILVTGGEPTIPRHFDEAVSLLNNLKYPIANVESNGMQLEALIQETEDSPNTIHFMYSPKFFAREDFDTAVIKTQNLLKYPNLFIKVVYEDRSPVIEYLEWLSGIITIQQANRVWLMPEGVTRADLIRNSEEVFNACEKYKFNFSSRSHIIFGFV
jgi:organic radical activating enzyme